VNGLFFFFMIYKFYLWGRERIALRIETFT